MAAPSRPPIFNGYDNLPRPKFQAGKFSIDDPRPMKVVVIGAGYSGIIAGIRFLQRVPNLHLTIYDKNAGVGGTWFVNRYPGIACDIPSHIYQLTFTENPNWSEFYASGAEILSYLESVVSKYRLAPYIKLQHRLTRAEWDEHSSKWRLTIRNELKPGEEVKFEDTADVLFTGLGGLSRWSWPDIEGLETFQGKVMHSADWEKDSGWEDRWRDKRVGVIGVGSSAIQIVPALQPRVKHLTNYVRGKTWVAATFIREHLVRLAGGDENVDNYAFTEEEKKRFADPVYYKKFRKEIESDLNAAHMATMLGSPMQEEGRKVFKAIMLEKLKKKPWIADHIIPDFAVACRRLTPGPGYLEALCEDNVDFISESIKRITPTGIETISGQHQPLDILICATGFDTSYHLPFPFIGRNGVTLIDKYTPHPQTYLSICVDDFPNWFQALGPSSAVGAGSLLLVLERQVDYAVAATLKMQRERIKSMCVKREAVREFDEYLESYFPTSVFGQRCRSWYKQGKEEGRVVALWPGSCLHAARALTHPRWEDFNYSYLDNNNRNRFYWLGDGLTVADKTQNADRAWYLDESEVDVPPVPGDGGNDVRASV